MNKKERIRRIWDESFPHVDNKWIDWFFDKVYDEDEALLYVKNGNAMSTLMLQRYTMAYGNDELPMAYIAGAATARKARGQGNMSNLMRFMLGEAYARGEVLAALIPDSRRLFGFYARMGFAPVVYTTAERYTSLHTFNYEGDFRETTPTAQMLRELSLAEGCNVLHSDYQFERIVEDIELDNGTIKAVVSNTTGERAIAFATTTDDVITVRTLLADGGSRSNAACAVLAAVKRALGQKHINVWAHSSANDRPIAMHRRGMIRIIDCMDLLNTIARQYPSTEAVVKVHDIFIPDNNGYYIMRDGRCRQVEMTMRKITLDVDIATLTRIVFGSPALSNVMGLPARRPSLDLMLD